MLTSKSDYTFVDFQGCTDILTGDIIPVADIQGRDASLRKEDLYYLVEMLGERNRIIYGDSVLWSNVGYQQLYASAINDRIVKIFNKGLTTTSLNTFYYSPIAVPVNPSYSAPSGFISVLGDELSVTSLRYTFSGLFRSDLSEFSEVNEDNPLTADYLRRLYYYINSINRVIYGSNGASGSGNNAVTFYSSTTSNWDYYNAGVYDGNSITYQNTNAASHVVGGYVSAPQYEGSSSTMRRYGWREEVVSSSISRQRAGTSKSTGNIVVSCFTKCTSVSAIILLNCYRSNHNMVDAEYGNVATMIDMSLSSDGKTATLNMDGVLSDAVSYAKSTWASASHVYTDVEVLDVAFVFTIDPPSKITGWNWTPSSS